MKKLFILGIIAVLAMSGCSGGSSDEKKEPWEEVGVSKKEFMKTYNAVKRADANYYNEYYGY